MANIDVLNGQRKEKVGTIPAAKEMLTNKGRITRFTEAGTVFVAVSDTDGNVTEEKYRNGAGLSVRMTEARRFGYPTASGCRRLKEVHIKRGDSLIVV